jgi:hypothetical protein
LSSHSFDLTLPSNFGIFLSPQILRFWMWPCQAPSAT